MPPCPVTAPTAPPGEHHGRPAPRTHLTPPGRLGANLSDEARYRDALSNRVLSPEEAADLAGPGYSPECRFGLLASLYERLWKEGMEAFTATREELINVLAKVRDALASGDVREAKRVVALNCQFYEVPANPDVDLDEWGPRSRGVA